MHEEHFRNLERFYHGAPINRLYEPQLTVEEGRAEVVMEVRPEHFHAAGALHGSVYFKALDDACFFAANSLVREVMVLTASFNLYFLRPVSAGSLRAIAKVVNQSRQLLIAEGELLASDGKTLARASGTFMRSQIALSDRLGYGLGG